jgi:cold shock CspA family protein
MRKLTAVLAAAIMVVALGSLVFAAEMQKGTIKSVDAKTGTVVFCPEGTNTDVTLKADDSVDVKSVKVGEKVEVTVDKNVLKGVKAAPMMKHSAPVGC